MKIKHKNRNDVSKTTFNAVDELLIREITNTINDVVDEIRKYKAPLYYVSYMNNENNEPRVVRYEYGIIVKDKEILDIISEAIRGEVDYIVLTDTGIEIQYHKRLYNRYGQEIGIVSDHESLYSLRPIVKKISDTDKLNKLREKLINYINNVDADKEVFLEKISKLKKLLAKMIRRYRNYRREKVKIILGTHESNEFGEKRDTYIKEYEGILIKDREFLKAVNKLVNEYNILDLFIKRQRILEEISRSIDEYYVADPFIASYDYYDLKDFLDILDDELKNDYNSEILSCVVTNNDIILNTKMKKRGSVWKYEAEELSTIIGKIETLVNKYLPNKNTLMKRVLDLD